MIEGVISSAKSYLPDLDEVRLREAFIFARDAHEGQMRKDGSPYICHPVAAAQILTDLKVDEDTLIACLLHDVPEDTDKSIYDIERKFGQTVSFLVEGITKLSKVHYRNKMAARQIESLKKLFLHSAQDPRIILIKLADRLHNMHTLDSIPKPEKRERIARETMEIYVPIANLLGVWQLKFPLEDACFRILNPEAFQFIDDQVKKTEESHTELIEMNLAALRRVFDSSPVDPIRIEGRPKSYYSIYSKMQRSGKNFNQIYDILGLRVIVEDVNACYQGLGVVHQNFTPKIGRLKDYIAIPKSNGYQSIHTTIFGVNKSMAEVQIRTLDMHLENEYGIAAHYFYRTQQSKKEEVKDRVKKKYQWVQKILDLQRNIQQNDRFMKHLKFDIFEDRIFVFTPKGDVIDLPVGATAIDFTYHIHSDLGLTAIDCEINGSQKNLRSTLKSGDVVLINTSEESCGPQVKWLEAAKTNVARTRIKEFLREKDKTELMNAAETLLHRKLELFTDRLQQEITEAEKLYLLDYFSLRTWEQLLMSIGNGSVDVHEVMAYLFEHQENHDPEESFIVSFCVELEDNIGMLGMIGNIVSQNKVNIHKIESVEAPGQFAILKLTIEVDNYRQFDRIIRSIEKISGVQKIMKNNDHLTDLR